MLFVAPSAFILPVHSSDWNEYSAPTGSERIANTKT